MNPSFWAGFFWKTIGRPCRRKRKAGFFLLRLGVNSARVLASPLHCCCIICTHSVSLFFSLPRSDPQMFRASAHPKSSQASSLQSLIPAEKEPASSLSDRCGFRDGTAWSMRLLCICERVGVSPRRSWLAVRSPASRYAAPHRNLSSTNMHVNALPWG